MKIEIRELLGHTRRYLLANPVSKKHHSNMVQRMARFIRWAGPNSVTILNADALNQFLTYLETQRLSPHTINGYRANIMAIWSDILGTRVIYKIRRAKTPQTIVDGWTLDEIRALCVAAKKTPGILPNGVTRANLLLTAIHSAFSTGQRYGDLVAMPVEKIASDGYYEVLQSKTGKIVSVRFSEMAMHFIRAHRQRVVLPVPHTQKWFCDEFNRLVARAGVRPGTFRWLRRSAGSYVEAATGRGHELLGNTRTVFEQNYRVARIVRKNPLEPPQIFRPGEAV